MDKVVKVKLSAVESQLETLWRHIPSLRAAPKATSLLALCDFGERYIQQVLSQSVQSSQSIQTTSPSFNHASFPIGRQAQHTDHSRSTNEAFEASTSEESADGSSLLDISQDDEF